ncbi:MAG: hypothetical protein ACPGJS_14855 [Flammeovirgaceae bacterium]
MSKKKNPDKKKPKVHPDLEGFDIKINSFGEITSSHSVEELNKFLNKNVVDKKLKDRDDLDVKREEED